MMRYHPKIESCPHCGKDTYFSITINSGILRGSPVRVCPHCQGTHFDSAYKEVGLLYFDEKGGTIDVGVLLWTLLSNAAVVFYVHSAMQTGLSTRLLLLFAISVILALVFDVGVIKTIWNRIHSEEYHQKKIDYIEGRTKERPLELVESMERLSNKEYLDALKEHRIDVPDYFYERLNYQQGGTE